MTTETCFLCGAPGPLRRVEVVVKRTHASVFHDHHHHDAQTTELRPLCEACIAKRDADAKAMLKVAGGTLAVMGGLMSLTFLVPLLFCLGGGALMALLVWAQR
jgi:hypothetical protein